MSAKTFFKNLGGGAAIGVAMIIPGVSGGTIAVLLNIYDDLIDAIGGLKSHFRQSMAFLLPVLLGAVLAFAAMYYPLKFALMYAPLPTVMLFAGLMAGSLPKLLSDNKKYGFDKKFNILSIVIPCVIIIGVCLIKMFFEIPAADLTADMPVWGYFLLPLIAIMGSCALVVPGLSGSMLLMIFGYYQPLLGTISALKESFGHSVLVLLIFALGLLFGFFSIARLMKYFLEKYPRGTRWAIFGFVIGSIPALFITFNGNFPEAPRLDGLQLGIGIVLLVLGAIGSYLFTAYAEKKIK